jgi:6-phosphogluconolactonase
MDAEIIIVQDAEELGAVAAERFAQRAIEAVAVRGRFSVALSGGGTPQGLYRRLAEPPYWRALPWRQVHLFWGDERAVPADHPESNFGQARELFIRHVRIPTGNVHPIRGELAPEAAARVYAAELEAFFGSQWPEFDLVLLGMGEDGHVAALFPDSPVLDETEVPVAASTGTYQGRPAERITLTLPAINAARHVLVLVSGAGKAPIVRRVLGGADPPATGPALPAERVRPTAGGLTWMVDAGAAGEMGRRR